MRHILIIFLFLSATYLHGQNRGTVGAPGGGFANQEDSIEIAVLSYRLADAVNGMSFVSQQWKAILVTDIDINELGVTLVDDSTFSVPAGKYQVSVSTSRFVGFRRISLNNVTDASITYSATNDPGLVSVIDLEAVNNFKIQGVTQSAGGFAHDGITGGDEIYLLVTIIKLQGNAGEITQDKMGAPVPDNEIVVGKGSSEPESFSTFRFNSGVPRLEVDGTVRGGIYGSNQGSTDLSGGLVDVGVGKAVDLPSSVRFYSKSAGGIDTYVTRNDGANGNFLIDNRGTGSIQLQNTAVTLAELDDNGQWNWSGYDAGAFDATPLKALGIDASENVITFAVPTDDQALTVSNDTIYLEDGGFVVVPPGAEVNDLSAAVTWVNVPDGNITQSSVTQHEAALAITESQITDLAHTPADGIGASLTAGSVVFSAGGTTPVQDNTNFFWDDANNRLGIGTNAPVTSLHVSMYTGTTSSQLLTSDAIVGVGPTDAAIGFNLVGVGSNAAHRGVFKGTRARGTPAAPTAVGNLDNTFSLLGAGYDGSTAGGVASAGITFMVDGSVSAGSVPQAIQFLTGSSTRIERMWIGANGRIGVNEDNPVAQFQIQESDGTKDALRSFHDNASTTFTSTFAAASLINANQTVNNYVRLNFGDGSTEATSVATQITNHALDYGDLVFYGRSAAGFNEHMRILSTGQVGIGTAAPDGKLTISNNVATTYLDNFSEYQILLYTGASAAVSYGLGIAGGTMRFNSGGSYTFDRAGAGTPFFISATDNIGIGTISFGGSASAVLAIANGTAPTSSPADETQIYSEDVASSSELFARNENGDVTLLTGSHIDLYKDVSQNVGGVAGTITYISWDDDNASVVKNPNFTHEDVTNPTRIEVATTGRYRLNWKVGCDNTGADRLVMKSHYRVNGTTTVTRGRQASYSRGTALGNEIFVGMDIEIELTAGDYIECGLEVEHTSATYTVNTIQADSYFQMRKI